MSSVGSQTSYPWSNNKPLTANLSTVDATTTTIFSVVIPAATTLLITAQIAARRTGGSAGTAEDGDSFVVFGAYKNVAGTATLIGSQGNIFSAKDQSGWAVTFSATGNTAILQVTGAANNNIDWIATYQSGTRVS